MSRRKGKIPGKVKFESKRIQPTSQMPSGKGRDEVRGTLASFGLPERLNLVAGPRKAAPTVPGFICTGAWKVNNGGEKLARFRQVSREIGNVRVLYHGTPSPNIAAIVEEGLRPGRPSCMFGSGIYLGDQNKAFGYTGGGEARYLIEVETALGKVWEQERADHSLTLESVQKAGYHSVAGVAGVTAGYAGALRHSEYVLYSPDQVVPLRVFEYQLSPMQEILWERGGGCAILKKSKNPIPVGMQAFRDLFEEITCGKKPTTRLATDDKEGYVDVCAECIMRLKLKKGDRIKIRRADYSGWGPSRRKGLKNVFVTIRGVKPNP